MVECWMNENESFLSFFLSSCSTLAPDFLTLGPLQAFFLFGMAGSLRLVFDVSGAATAGYAASYLLVCFPLFLAHYHFLIDPTVRFAEEFNPVEDLR